MKYVQEMNHCWMWNLFREWIEHVFTKLLECFKGTEITFPTNNTQQEIQETEEVCEKIVESLYKGRLNCCNDRYCLISRSRRGTSIT